jgi:hypothetical protein
MGAGGTMALRSGAVSETAPESETNFTVSLSSPKMEISWRRISSGECPGKMRQLTMACAVCGSALLAWPAVRRVATQVVRKLALKVGWAERRAAAARSVGVAMTAAMSAAVEPVSMVARLLK